MNEKLIELKTKFDDISYFVGEMNFSKNNTSDIIKSDFPFLNANDLFYFPQLLSKKISKVINTKLSEADIEKIENIIHSLDNIQPQLERLNHVHSSVSRAAISSYFISMLYISSSIDEIFLIESLNDRKLLPREIARKLNEYDRLFSEIEKRKGDLEHKLNEINKAYDTLENLPMTLNSFRHASKKIKEVEEFSQKSRNNIDEAMKKNDYDIEEINNVKEKLSQFNESIQQQACECLNELKEEAQTYIDKCEEAFRTSTSKGLAGAFEDKAKKLNVSIRCWVAGLLLALAAGAFVGYTRLHALEAYLSNPGSSGVKLAIQLILSIMSISAPLWFAWLATKQIGQRFRLAEDYEFKASVSKAYEGYRREAVQLDSDFSERLFGNALSRLEEPPLRFINNTTHSSPIMEILSSDCFKKMVEKGGESLDVLLENAGLARKKR